MVDIQRVVHDRDEEGELVAEEGIYIKEFDVEGEDDPTVDAKPLTNADQDEYIQPFLEAITAASAIAREEVDFDDLDEEAIEELQSMGRDALSDEKLAEMYEKKIENPDLLSAYQETYPDRDIEHLDEDFIQNELRTGAKDGLLFGVLYASEMDDLVEALRATVEFGDEPDGDDSESGNE